MRDVHKKLAAWHEFDQRVASEFLTDAQEDDETEAASKPGVVKKVTNFFTENPKKQFQKAREPR